MEDVWCTTSASGGDSRRHSAEGARVRAMPTAAPCASASPAPSRHTCAMPASNAVSASSSPDRRRPRGADR